MEKIFIEVSYDENIAKAYKLNDKIDVINEISKQLLNSQISFGIRDVEQELEYYSKVKELQDKDNKYLKAKNENNDINENPFDKKNIPIVSIGTIMVDNNDKK